MKRPISIIPLLLLTVFVIAFIIPVRGGTVSRGIRIVAKSGESLYLYKDYHALVVGVGDYTQGWPDLPGAVKDAREVASSLKELGFKVKLILDPTSSQFKTTLNDIAFGLGMDRNRALLLYYAGHGETLELADGTELGYIIPTDCPLKSRDPKGFDNKAVSMRDIEDLALKVKSKHFLMLFDSCFSGSLFSLVRAAPVDITEKSARPVRQFITAGEAGEQVPDKSIFKIVFLDGIKGEADLNSDGYVTGSELGMHLQDKVVNYTRGGQHPQYGKINNPKLDKGDFIFALKARSLTSTQVSVAPPTPPEPSGIGEYDKVIQERKAAKYGWDQWQAKMEVDYVKAERHNRSPDLTSEEKAGLWASFLSSYRADNPYSTKDEELREIAQERHRDWKEFKVPMGKKPPVSQDKKIFTNSIGMKFVLIPAGTFVMGSPPGEPGRDDDERRHRVTISRPFYLQTTEVTQGQWKRVMGKNPSHFKDCGDECPVEMTSWNDAQEFIGRLNQMEGVDKYRLPTEPEWEYACRADSTTRFYFGEHDGRLEEYAWCASNSGKKTHRVGEKKPNSWGLYDMLGNVWEWCQDRYEDYPSGSEIIPAVRSAASNRVFRGGGWGSYARHCRSAFRYNLPPGVRHKYLGFRLVRGP